MVPSAISTTSLISPPLAIYDCVLSGLQWLIVTWTGLLLACCPLLHWGSGRKHGIYYEAHTLSTVKGKLNIKKGHGSTRSEP